MANGANLPAAVPAVVAAADVLVADAVVIGDADAADPAGKKSG